MILKILKLAGYLLLIAFIIGTLAFTSKETRDVVCRGIEVDFSSDEIIKLSKEQIIRMADMAGNQVKGKMMREINADIIEQQIEKNQAILNAEVCKIVVKDSTTYEGILAVKVKHRVPVVRIMSSDGSYYLDKYGSRIPVSASYAANVLVASGYFSGDFAVNQILPFILFINKDDFWKAQIEQIHVENGGNVWLIPLVGDQKIELGSFDNYEEKLRNLYAFYTQVMSKNNWNKYQSISVKYKDQVIAKKR